LAARASQLAGEALHPNDHVNASQSTNDTYPTAMALALLDLAQSPVLALKALADTFGAKAGEYEDTRRLGRTCLQDAVTLTVGQTHRAHARAIRRAADGLHQTSLDLRAVPLGATVLGTEIGAPVGYRALALKELGRLTGHDVTGSPDLLDALSNLDGYAAVAAAGARAGLTMAKIAADLRFLSSGPVGGIGEVVLPALQAGSSIMPGKVNPVIPEYVMQLSYRIRGSAHAAELAVAAGELELNIMEPVIVDSLVGIFEDLTAGAETFARHCVAGLTWDGPRLKANMRGQFDRWVAMAAEEGYDATTEAVRADTSSGEAVR
jgi:aspartate ammonia-lyase